MAAYVDSGRTARQRLVAARKGGEERRLLDSLRSCKQVINTFCVAGIVLTPLLGVLARSSFVALFVALHFLALVCVLELYERRVKKQLIDLRNS